MVESLFSKFKEDKVIMLSVQVHKGMLQCTQPKRRRDATWFKEKVLLVQAQAEAFQTDDLDAYDSDCDDISLAKAVLMANLSSCDSDVLSEFPQIDIGLAVPTFLLGDDPIACMNKAMAFLSDVFTPRYPSTNNQLRSSSNPINQATVQDGSRVEGKELDEEKLSFLTDPKVVDG
ncbi:hypothetical protein Tco_1463392, partial [Tanacetum coccineum]